MEQTTRTLSGELQDPWSSCSHIASTGGGNEYLCFLFRSNKNSGCYGNLEVSIDLYGEKVEIGIFHCQAGDI